VFVNNAGILLEGTIDQVSLKDLDKMLGGERALRLCRHSSGCTSHGRGWTHRDHWKRLSHSDQLFQDSSTYSMTKAAVAGG